MPFQFPDSAVSQRVTNPSTGEVWVFEEGVWMIEEAIEVAPTATPAPTPTPEPTPEPSPAPRCSTPESVQPEEFTSGADSPTYNININTGSNGSNTNPISTSRHCHSELEAEIILLKQKAETLHNDIIEVKTELQSVLAQNFLILE
jgi:hypothetical protein